MCFLGAGLPEDWTRLTLVPAGQRLGPGEVEITSPLGILVEDRFLTLPIAQPSAFRTAFASGNGTLLSVTTRH